MSKNFEILMKVNGTGDPLDAVPNGAEPNADYHADRASTSSQSSSGVDAPDSGSVRPGSERNGSRSHGAHSPATALQRRSWGLMLAHMLGNRSLENASSLGVCPRAGVIRPRASRRFWDSGWSDSLTPASCSWRRT